MAVVVEVLGYLTADHGQFGRVLAPFGIAQNLFERDFLTHGGESGLVLPCAEELHGQASRFREEAEQKIVASRFRLEGAAEEVTEALAPVFTGGGRRIGLAFGNIQRIDEVNGRGGHMAAGTVEGFHAVAHGIDPLLGKIDGDHGAVGFEVLSLHGAFHRPHVVFKAQGELAEIAFGLDGAAILGNVFGYGVLNERFGKPAGGDFLASVHGNRPQDDRRWTRPGSLVRQRPEGETDELRSPEQKRAVPTIAS